MNKTKLRKAAAYLAHHIFTILGLIGFLIFVFLGVQLIVFALPCISGEQIVTLTTSQVYGLFVVAFGFIFILFGEYFARLMKVVDKILEEKL